MTTEAVRGESGAKSVLLLDGVEPSDLPDLADEATLVPESHYDSRAELENDLSRFDAVVVLTSEIDETFLTAADSLSVVAKRGVGVDNVDVGAATERGVLVCNTPGANARAVAEHALGLLVAVRHRIALADRSTRAGEWDRDRFETSELGGDRLGLFGAGDTGQTLARLAEGIGMTVLAYDPYVDASALPDGAEMVSSPEALFDRADAVSVHVPLTDETRRAVGAGELDRLSPDGILVNTARGGVVDEDALVRAVESGAVAGAGLDVFQREPPAADHPLFDADTVVLTPHVAGATVEANAAKYDQTARNVSQVFAGTVPDTALNPAARAGESTDPTGESR